MVKARGASLRVDAASLKVGTSRLKASCIAWSGSSMGMMTGGMNEKSSIAHLRPVVVVV